jgi:hypothetical protein
MLLQSLPDHYKTNNNNNNINKTSIKTSFCLSSIELRNLT